MRQMIMLDSSECAVWCKNLDHLFITLVKTIFYDATIIAALDG